MTPLPPRPAARAAQARRAARAASAAPAAAARLAVSAAVSAAAARLAYAGLRRQPPGGAATWSRTNHRGDAITLLEGPAVAAGGMAGAILAPGLAGRERAALLLAGASAAALGSYDDLAGSGQRRGFRGHLGALRHGEITTGTVKLAGIGAAGLAASLLARPPASRPGRPPAPARAADIVVNAGLVAGSANLLNLFDLRPGRAIKVALAAGAMLSAPARGRQAAAAPLAAAAALLPEDLGERAMLGDGGANALGAMLGAAAAISLPRPARIATLAVITALTAASEKVSFTQVIHRTPPLNWLDMLGRRPPAPPAAASSASPGRGDAPAPDDAAATDGGDEASAAAPQ